MTLREALKEAGIRQVEIAEAIGAPAETVNRWFNGRHFPSGRHLPALLSFLNQPRVLKRLGRTKPIAIDEFRYPWEAA